MANPMPAAELVSLNLTARLLMSFDSRMLNVYIVIWQWAVKMWIKIYDSRPANPDFERILEILWLKRKIQSADIIYYSHAHAPNAQMKDAKKSVLLTLERHQMAAFCAMRHIKRPKTQSREMLSPKGTLVFQLIVFAPPTMSMYLDQSSQVQKKSSLSLSQ